MNSLMIKSCLIILLLVLSNDLTGSDERMGKCVSGDCISGRGTFIYDSADEFTGKWKNGKRHGYGTMTWIQVSINRIASSRGPGQTQPLWIPVTKYDAALLAAFSIATGIYSDRSKSDGVIDQDIKYIGNWENDMMHGNGALHIGNGRIITGKWKNNEYTGE